MEAEYGNPGKPAGMSLLPNSQIMCSLEWNPIFKELLSISFANTTIFLTRTNVLQLFPAHNIIKSYSCRLAFSSTPHNVSPTHYFSGMCSPFMKELSK